MPMMTWEALLNSPQPTAAGTALHTSTTLTDISVAPQFTLPANFLLAGSALRFTAHGVFSNTGTPTLLLGIYYGGVAGVALAASAATTTTTGATNWKWRVRLETTIRSSGQATGTAWSQGELSLGTSATAMTTLALPGGTPAAVTVDTTAAKTLTVGAQWGTSSASNTITLHGFYIESLGA
jgi:hypothetical protein